MLLNGCLVVVAVVVIVVVGAVVVQMLSRGLILAQGHW
jgi:hypothetical protein